MEVTREVYVDFLCCSRWHSWLLKVRLSMMPRNPDAERAIKGLMGY